MSDEVLIYAVDQQLATITLNNPAKRNALGLEMTTRLEESLVAAAKDPAVRAILITGAGPAFSSGGDLERLTTTAEHGATLADQRSPLVPDEFFNVIPDVPPVHRTRYSFAMAIPKPVIAAVNGPAVGAGFVLALHCDIRFGSTNAAFLGGFARIGATPEMGLSWTLPRVVGAGRAREILLSGRRVEAREALEIGLMSRMYAPDELMPATVEYARELAAGISPRSARVIKRQLREVMEQTFAEAFFTAADDARETLASHDFKEGVAAAREKRRPQFQDL